MGRAIFKHPLHYMPCLRLSHSNYTHSKRFKALIDSAAAISLTHTSVSNMIKVCYNMEILPAAEYLKSADRSSMSSLGKATSHLCIVNFKLSQTFIICDKLPETGILFSIDIQKRHSLSYSLDSDKQLFIQREG